jgi:hypothetical protein
MVRSQHPPTQAILRQNGIQVFRELKTVIPLLYIAVVTNSRF